MRGWEVAVQQPYAISPRLTSLLSLQQTNKARVHLNIEGCENFK